jgi:hypothetical protein
LISWRGSFEKRVLSIWGEDEKSNRRSLELRAESKRKGKTVDFGI